MVDVEIEQSWKEVLASECSLPYFEILTESVRRSYNEHEPVFPPPKLIFNAFSLCPFDSVKVVILGQDPYHGYGQAHGLCFSVPDGVKIPPSLKNIYKEIQSDLDIVLPQSGNLEYWARQGVLLLNTTLTVLEGKPASHQDLGWQRFTDAVIAKVSDEKKNVVFLLWGTFAHRKATLIDSIKHKVLTAPHPSPLSAYTGFFGCKHFSQTNSYLESHGGMSIHW